MRVSFLFSEVLTGLRRNVTMTVAMILTTAISLIMLGGGMIAVRMADKTQEYFLNRVEVRLYMTDDVSDTDPDCTQETCKKLLDQLKSSPGVVSVEYLNRADALKEAKEKTFKDQPELAKLITANALPASLRVKMANADEYHSIYDKYHDSPGVANVRNDKDIVDRLVSLFDGMRNAAFGLALVQALAALLLIANMVQIAAFTRREEVAIMRLVGATRWYTQLPFLIEAVAAAMAGTFLAVIGLLFAKLFVLNQLLGNLFASKVFPMISFSDVLSISIWLGVIGIFFAAATAYATLRYYVRDETS